jgi:formylglycine-generating enzyme required for sulfatase activity
MNRYITSLFLVGASCLLAPQSASAVTIPTVLIGNVGNANDPLTGGLYGGVSYAYRIGSTEVTNAQYTDFLNLKAKSDPLGLYNENMGSNLRGGITRSGATGSFTYATRANMADKPVNFVSWYDSIRFANWLNNGQGAGSTESGAYTIVGNTATPSNGPSITRNVGAMWFLPSENEWYKAAYYQPTAEGGDADNYWLYPAKSNSEPTIATANDVGDINNPGANVANYNIGAGWNGQDFGNVTTVGSAGPLSQSFYGTSDQGGNVFEWTEANNAGFRNTMGGSHNSAASFVQSSSRIFIGAFEGANNNGFRVATVPEASTLVLTALGALGLPIAARRKR